MLNFLNKIRAKSDAEKKSFAFIVATTLTVVIAIVWFVSVYAVSSREAVENKAQTISPIQNIRSQFNVFTE